MILIKTETIAWDHGEEKKTMAAYQFLFGVDRTRDQDEIAPSEIHEKALRFDSARIVWVPCMTLKGPKLITTAGRFGGVFGDPGLPSFGADEILTRSDNLLQGKRGETLWLNLKNLKITGDPNRWPRGEDKGPKDKGVKKEAAPDALSEEIEKALPRELQKQDIPGNLVFVAEAVFSHLAVKCLEIRTSVSIDRVARAGKDGALFTYELLPRGTLLHFSVAVSHIMADRYHPPASSALQKSGAEGMWEILDKAAPYFEFVGIGGMTSRGFGKCRIIEMGNGR